jgi:V8-like Glu-specific endopeptidase
MNDQIENSEQLQIQKDNNGNSFTPSNAGNPIEIVFPPDNRTRVKNSSLYPFNCIGLVEMEFPNKKKYTGTGILIADNLVLTAAHNVFDKADGGKAISVTFQAGRNGDSMPWGAINAIQINYPPQWENAGLSNPHIHGNGVIDASELEGRQYDYALLTLESAPHLGQGVIGVSVESDKILHELEVNITGYPGDKSPKCSMWGANGPILKLAPNFLLYKISTYRGESGAGILAQLKNKPEETSSVGIHIGSTEYESQVYNLAVRITETVIQNLQTWTKK